MLLKVQLTIRFLFYFFFFKNICFFVYFFFLYVQDLGFNMDIFPLPFIFGMLFSPSFSG